MLGSCRASTSRSRYATWTDQGTIVAASAQPARPSAGSPSPRTLGTTLGTAPSSVWSCARSTSQLAQKARASNSVQAVAANAGASPVQPSRSSRWGQSVGTATKLSRCDQRTFSWNRVRSASEQAEARPDRGVAADGEHLGGDQLRVAHDLCVAEPVERE